MVLRRYISDITLCPICLEVLDTPTSLPCLHTFCLRCLQRTFAADSPGDEASCPVCRRDFCMPAAGLATLPRNFTLDGLVALQCAVPTSAVSQDAVETASNDNAVPVCSETTNDADSAADEDGLLTAAGNSADTDSDNDCSKCSTLTLAHQHDQQSRSTEDATTSSTHCDMHAGVDATTEFCFDCRVDVCATCGGEAHRRHRRRRAGDVTAECRRRVASQLARVTDALSATHVALMHVDRRRADLLQEMEREECLIREERSDEDDDDVERRLSALSVEKDDALRRLAVSYTHLTLPTNREV